VRFSRSGTVDAKEVSIDCEAASLHLSVSVHGLSKTFDGENDVLTGIGFDVAPGSIVALLGPSGCGKTTLIRILCGLEVPSSGSVRIGDANPETLRKEGRIGMAFQEPALFPWRTVFQNISLPLEIQGRPDKSSVDRVVKLLRLENTEHLKPAQLSGGMAQRVAVARALVTRPDILLLDEPFGALDWFLRRHIIIDFEQVWLNEKSTTIIVTHETREAAFLADRIVVLSSRPGRILSTIDVSLPRPRSSSIFTTEEFHSFCDLIDAKCEAGA
jgi:NitT/TauT family transport system ATP-binding protein